MARFALIGLLFAAGPLAAQDLLPADKPTPAAPVHLTPDQQRAQDLKKLFARAALEKNRGRFLDAIRTLEECVRLDPDAAPPRKLLATLYRVVGRMDDAAANARLVVTK
ncbi:MAG: hypothetical protein ACJ8F7_17370, partial [Gemmataceae bacterium]